MTVKDKKGTTGGGSAAAGTKRKATQPAASMTSKQTESSASKTAASAEKRKKVYSLRQALDAKSMKVVLQYFGERAYNALASKKKGEESAVDTLFGREQMPDSDLLISM